MVIESCVALSSVDIVSYEFFEGVWDGGIMDDLVYEGVDVNCIKSLREVYCYECSARWGLFLIESTYDWVYD